MLKQNRQELNEALRLLRVYHDLSRSELINEMKISKSYLSEIETGSKQVSLDMIERYAKFFELKPSMILLLGESLAEGASAKKAEHFFAGKARKLMAWIIDLEETNRKRNEAI